MSNLQRWTDLWNQGSFVSPVPAPNVDPGSAPTVCVQFNALWLPYVLGALFQLVQPTAYESASTGYADAVEQAQDLMAIFSEGGVCTDMLQFQFTDTCGLQYSVDGGETWIDVPGWNTFAAGCFTGPVGATGPPGGYTPGVPPILPGQDAEVQACNVAGYIASVVIQNAIASVVSGIEASEAVLPIGLAVLGILAGADPVVDLVLVAANALFDDIQGGTLSQYEAASTDATLLADMTCAIFLAIETTGYVTDANFASVVANVAAITYTYPDVIATIVDYLNGLGALGLEAVQIPGGLASYDCSGCVSGAWCYKWDFTETAGPWTPANSETGAYVPGVGFESFDEGGASVLAIITSFPTTTFTSIEPQWTASNSSGGAAREMYLEAGATLVVLSALDGSAHSTPFSELVTYTSGQTGDNYTLVINTNGGGTSAVITGLVLTGTGTCPFGTPNC